MTVYSPASGAMALTGGPPLVAIFPSGASAILAIGDGTGLAVTTGVGLAVDMAYAPQILAPGAGTMVTGGFPPKLISTPWFDYEETVISQYANSPAIDQLVVNFNDWVRPGANFEAFYSLIWNVDTAQGYGLDVWGRIVGVSRVLYIPALVYFGFEETGDNVGFNQGGPFFNGASATESYLLGDNAFRTLILAKAAANICDGSIPSINRILLALFPNQGNCYVTDGENMSMTYTFSTDLSVVNLAIVEQSGVLPKPAGVSVTVVQP